MRREPRGNFRFSDKRTWKHMQEPDQNLREMLVCVPLCVGNSACPVRRTPPSLGREGAPPSVESELPEVAIPGPTFFPPSELEAEALRACTQGRHKNVGCPGACHQKALDRHPKGQEGRLPTVLRSRAQH